MKSYVKRVLKEETQMFSPCLRPLVSLFSQAVLRGQQQSRWLQAFLSTNKNRRVVNYYLEDDHQLDQVYCYLNQLYAAEMSTAACLTQVSSMERVPFVLDVLLPEVFVVNSLTQ